MTQEINTKEELTHEYIEKTRSLQLSVMEKMGIKRGDHVREEWWVHEAAKMFRDIVDNKINGENYSDVVDLVNNDQLEEAADLIKEIMEKKLHTHA